MPEIWFEICQTAVIKSSTCCQIEEWRRSLSTWRPVHQTNNSEIEAKWAKMSSVWCECVITKPKPKKLLIYCWLSNYNFTALCGCFMVLKLPIKHFYVSQNVRYQFNNSRHEDQFGCLSALPAVRDSVLDGPLLKNTLMLKDLSLHEKPWQFNTTSHCVEGG